MITSKKDMINYLEHPLPSSKTKKNIETTKLLNNNKDQSPKTFDSK